MTSHEKVTLYVQAWAQAGDSGMGAIGVSMAAAAPLMLSQLPPDPADLDAQLAAYAGLFLELRSDSADALVVAGADDVHENAT